MKRFGIILSLLLATNVYGQGTQINGSQIKDGTITGVKISPSAAIAYTKINFTGMPASIVNAENPLTFNTPLSRTTNTISLSTVPVTLGGTGVTAVTAGRLLFGGSSSQLATHANLTFDSGNNRFFIGGTSGASTLNVNGTANVTTDLTVGGTFTINGKLYQFPVAYGASGSVLTDVAGDGVVTWQPTASAGVTLQGSDPGTPDTGGINISGKIYVGTDADIGGVLGFQGITRPTDTWTGGPLPSAQVWNTAVSSVDQNAIGTSQQALVWSDAAQGYVADFYSTSETNGNVLLVQSSDLNGKLITGSSVGSDKFIVYNKGSVYVAPDSSGLASATTNNAATFLNLGQMSGPDPSTFLMLRAKNFVPFGSLGLEVYATATVTSTGVAPTDGDQVKVGSVTYTFKSPLTPSANEVFINGSAANALINLEKAVNLTGVANTDYGAGTVANPDATAASRTATTLKFTAIVAGTGGNALDSTTPVGATFSFPGATFGGGAIANFVGGDFEFANASEIALDAPRGLLTRMTTSGDFGTSRGLFASGGFNGDTGGGYASHTGTELNGARLIVEVAGTAQKTLTDAVGVRAENFLNSATTIVTNSYNIAALNDFTTAGTTTVTNAFGLKLFNTWSAGTTVTNQYGLYYEAPTVGTATSQIGIHLDDVGSAAGSYAIQSLGGKSEFAGSVKAGWFANSVGTPVADAATITPAGQIVHVTGTGTPITTVTVPYSGFTGSITLICDDVAGFTTATGGNIAVGSTVTQNHTLTLTYDGTSWYPNY